MTDTKTVGIGIIGTGFARTTQLPGFRACSWARVVSIASAHKARAERVAREFGVEHFTDDWREVVARDDVDLVSIVTPPDTHMEMTRAALDAGKAVLCEKPTAMNAQESDVMRRHAHEASALALIDHELRFLASRLRMREMISHGDIGEVHHAKYFFRADSRADKQRAWNWWSDAAHGGGTLGAIGSHAVDSLRWLLGAEVAAVCGSLATHISERPDEATASLRPVTSDDESNLLLRLSDGDVTQGATATVSLSVVEQGRPEHRVEIFGADGALREAGGQLWHARTGEGDWRSVDTAQGELAAGMRESEWSRGFTAFSAAIVAALREGGTHLEGAANFDDGHRVQLVLDAARRSQVSGRWEDATLGS